MIARILLVAVALISTTGCGVAFTSIRQDPDGSYVVTSAHSGFFTMNGQVFHCTGEANKMACQLASEN
jgi:hypothetical protein